MSNRTILRRMLLITSLGSSLLWVGCNESEPSPSGPGGNAHAELVNACSLLTSTEAAAVMGQPVLVVRADTVNYSTFCTYEGATAPGSLLPTHVDVTVFTSAGLEARHSSAVYTAPKYFSDLQTVTPTADKTPVPGIGSDAIWLKRPGKLSFYKSDVYAEVRYSVTGKIVDTTAASFEGCKTAALGVAARI